jgi:hypothetical protein
MVGKAVSCDIPCDVTHGCQMPCVILHSFLLGKNINVFSFKSQSMNAVLTGGKVRAPNGRKRLGSRNKGPGLAACLVAIAKSGKQYVAIAQISLHLPV